MRSGRRQFVLLAGLLSACGGRAGESVTSAAAGSAGERAAADSAGERAVAGSGAAGSDASLSAGAGMGGSAVAADAGAGGAAARSGAGSSALAGGGSSGGSAGAALQAAAHCNDSSPLVQGGGYVQCPGGLLRRPNAGTCVSSLPRAKPDAPLAFSECTSDTDCSASPHGFCAYGECKYGCVSDAECPSDQACFCGSAIGACVPASCHSDADCPAKLPCVAYVAPGFALPDALACQSPADECLTTPECYSLNPRVSCKFQVDHRICYQDPVS